MLILNRSEWFLLGSLAESRREGPYNKGPCFRSGVSKPAGKMRKSERKLAAHEALLAKKMLF